MSLIHLNIHNLRNIVSASLTLNSRYNIFYGPNGSGKTSLLEAIYLLGNGHSFRTREATPLITHNQEALTIFGRTQIDESISIQKNISGSTFVKVNQQPCQRSSDLAYLLPCQIFYQDIFQIMDAGPGVRRNLLDWGLFHVKQSYHQLLKEYRHVLKQRNALLRQKNDYQQFIPWDKLLVDLAEEIHSMRADYFKEWQQIFQEKLSLLTAVSCEINYYKGWDRRATGKSLAMILNEQFTLDKQRQYTHYGIHQADILFDSESIRAKQTLSRGQQKVVLIGLKLAQSQLLNKPCLYLFDDIGAELDTNHLVRLMSCLDELPGQFFFTTIRPELISLKESASFHINNGVLKSIDN